MTKIGNAVREGIAEQAAEAQRKSDEVRVGTGSRQHYAQLLEELTSSFGRSISVLDVGCGTGRFFHCLRNVENLLGVDASPHMLDQARAPCRAEMVDVKNIELLCADVLEVDLCGREFDLVYSIGVLGEYVPFTVDLCKKLLAWLKPNGTLFFTIVDTRSRLDRRGARNGPVKRRVLNRALPLLPAWLRERLNKRKSSVYMTRSEIEQCMRGGHIARYEISRYLNPVGSGWQGAHYDCVAVKT